MRERRKLQRLRALKAGTISLSHARDIIWRVRNMSPAAACLEVTSQIGIPGNFVLLISYNKFSRACHVIWRSETKLGVQFVSSERSA